jgi:phytoene desaturase
MARRRVLVIGGGFGGLSAAIRLAASGATVVVLEQRDAIGGRAGTYRLTGSAGEHVFDAGPTVLTAPHLFEELFTLAGQRLADHVELLPVDPFYRVFGPDGQRLDYRRDVRAMRAEIEHIRPRDGEGFSRLTRRSAGIYDALYPFTERDMMNPALMLGMLPYLAGNRAFLPVYPAVAGEVRDPFVRQALSFHPLLIGGSPMSTPALYLLIPHLERTYGVHHAAGGTTALVAALGRLLEDLGGTVRLNSRVTQILLAHRRAVGVRLEDGSTELADAIVCNQDAAMAMRTLLPPQPRTRLAAARAGMLRPSMSLAVLYVGIGRRYHHTDLLHHNVLVTGSYRGAIRSAFSGRAWSDGQVPDDLFLYAHLPSRLDRSVAPAEGETMYVLAAVPSGDDIDWEHTAPLLKQRIYDGLEPHLPGLRRHVSVEHMVDPRFFGGALSSDHGAAFASAPTLLQSGWFRPHNRSRAARGLYLVGAGTHPGAGLPAVLASGRIAANLVLRDQGLR